jgi:hypothetical protein
LQYTGYSDKNTNLPEGSRQPKNHQSGISFLYLYYK